MYILPELDPRAPPQDGATIKSAVDLVEFNSTENGCQLFCLQAYKTLDGTDLHRITYKEFRDMVSNCQGWIDKYIPQSSIEESKTPQRKHVALLLDSDVGLLVYLFAIMGCGLGVCRSRRVRDLG